SWSLSGSESPPAAKTLRLRASVADRGRDEAALRHRGQRVLGAEDAPDGDREVDLRELVAEHLDEATDERRASRAGDVDRLVEGRHVLPRLEPCLHVLEHVVDQVAVVDRDRLFLARLRIADVDPALLDVGRLAALDAEHL